MRHLSFAGVLWAIAMMLALPASAEQASTILKPSTSKPSASPVADYDPRRHAASAASDRQAARIVKAWQTEPVILPWTALTLEMIVKHKVAPTRAARGGALVHVAMHDAWELSKDDAIRPIAVSAAAAQVLAYWFPSEEHGFDRIVAALIVQTAEKGSITPNQLKQALQLGWDVGRRTISRGESDGAERGWNGVRLEWYGEGRYYGPGTWEPTPPYFYYPPNEPFAPGWKTWVLESAGQFRPVPPAFGSTRFLQDLNEVVSIQKDLAQDQLRIARFWVDGSGSVTPPGHWNQIAMDLVRAKGLDDRQTARLFAALNIALADTFIAVWDVKYHYWTARPVTMAKTVLGIDLKPAILTPPFPSYVSGHAAFSGAAARVIGAFFASEARQLDAMAEEAAMSRLYGGIHFRHDNEDGLALGRAVGEHVLKKLGSAPAVATKQQ